MGGFVRGSRAPRVLSSAYDVTLASSLTLALALYLLDRLTGGSMALSSLVAVLLVAPPSTYAYLRRLVGLSTVAGRAVATVALGVLVFQVTFYLEVGLRAAPASGLGPLDFLVAAVRSGIFFVTYIPYFLVCLLLFLLVVAVTALLVRY